MRHLRGTKGQGMTEYILLVALIAIAVIAAVKYFGKSTDKGFRDAADKIGNGVHDSIKKN